MSIFPSTDMIADVSRAADPGKVTGAMRRLADAGAARQAHGSGFADAMRATGATRAKEANTPSASRAKPAAPAIVADSGSRAAEELEAFILQGWLEILLPKVEGGAFGSGAAGGVWRSMMAEQMGSELARAGGFGLQRLIGSHQSPGEGPSST